MLKLHIISNGFTLHNLKGLYSGRNDEPLCSEAIKDINTKKSKLVYPQANLVISSPLKRCLDTCELLYPRLQPLVIDDLAEFNFGEFEGRSADELHKQAPLFDRWLSGEPGVKPPFGESNEEFANRICGTFYKIVDGIIKTNSDNCVIFTHAGVIATIMHNFALPKGSVTQWMPGFAEGYTLMIHPSWWAQQSRLEAVAKIPCDKSEKHKYYDGFDYEPQGDSE